jgi:hypothetical protein
VISLNFLGCSDEELLEVADDLIDALELEYDLKNPWKANYYIVHAGSWWVNEIQHQFCFGRVDPDGVKGGFAVTIEIRDNGQWELLEAMIPSLNEAIGRTDIAVNPKKNRGTDYPEVFWRYAEGNYERIRNDCRLLKSLLKG